MEQIGFEIALTPVEAVIEAHAEAWRANTKRMVAEAIEHINRSCGQLQRHVRERHAREAQEFWEGRLPWEERSKLILNRLIDNGFIARI